MALTMRQYDRNNHVIKLLSAPNFGLSITHKQCLRWETRLANAVIDNMKENDNTYIYTTEFGEGSYSFISY